MPQRRNGHPREVAKPITDKPINRLPDAVKETGSAGGQRSGEALNTAGQKMDDMAASLGGSMQSLAGNLRSAAPGQETLGQLASGFADVLDRTGRFLEKEGASGLADQINQMIRRNPLSAVLAAAGIGFLLAQTIRR